MASTPSGKWRSTLIWGSLLAAILVPLGVAALSPLLAWRAPIYIVAGFAGVLAMAVLLVQPLLIGGYLPDLSPRQRRQLHQWTGAVLVVLVVAHVLGLWVTSPPDVIDALLVRSPTPFSIWGVMAMWGVFMTAALFGVKWRLQPYLWRVIHTVLVTVIVVASVVHALMIDGTMGSITKVALCAMVLAGMAKVIFDKHVR
ncbi:MAG: ferric reductase-like transmembrane domain-containing protein [Pseudoruegeria sp.]